MLRINSEPGFFTEIFTELKHRFILHILENVVLSSITFKNLKIRSISFPSKNLKRLTLNNRLADLVTEVACLVPASSGVSSSPESRYQPRRLDGAAHTCWCASTGTAATSRHSDDGRRDDEELPSQLDPTASTSTSTLPRQSHQHHHHHRPSRDEGEPSGRCPSCGQRRREEIFYTIEDLDAIEPAPLESQRTPTLRTCSCDQPETSTSERERGDLRKYRSTETRWTGGSFLSPDDAIWDLKKRASDGTEFRWELHTSNTDLDLAKKTKCSCHSLTPEEKKSHEVQRGDLRKHHSAETDKWSVKPDYLELPMHDLRKHSSDDTRMAREARWLQVPEVLPNPKPRCTCPKPKTLPPASPVELKEQEVEKPKIQEPTVTAPERKLYYSASLNVERPEEPPAIKAEKPELKKHASEDTRMLRPERPRDRPKLERSHARVDSQMSKKWSVKEKVTSPEEVKKVRSKWAMKTHFSLPAEEKKPKWRSQESTEAFKSKSLKERPKYSIRRIMSPEPDPRQISRLENRIVRRLISPEITITDAKWAPYEDASPLPTIGIKKREPKHISEIKWTPYDGSPTTADHGGSFAVQEPEEPKSWSPFHNVTPTHHPPPEAAPCSDDEEFRWRILNQVSAFPIYQGGWKDESPERTPPRTAHSSVDLSTPIWAPQVPASPMKRQRSQQQCSPQPAPPVHRKSIAKVRGLSKKKPFRARSESSHQGEMERLVPPTVIVRAASEEPKGRQRPQLMRSKALLEVPVPMGITKRSLSEEVPRARSRDRPRGPNRARSEEAPKCDDPWFRNEDLQAGKTAELREYVTTV
ncbi:uncharacterized protein LOC143178518 [Calliopsis andreniformis]|uniref:uncharacterized protein LOC143178518 n=1 Tax=Calliopsis andreniformis TaxID=337506 RepID=UPI003FCC5181